MLNPIAWITAANVLYLVSYAVRDILWLRILTVVAATLLIPYYLLQTTPLYVAVGWNVVFIAINCYWIVRLSIERRPVHFTRDEELLHQLSFASLTPHETQDLYAMGTWVDFSPETSILKHDHDTSRFSVILRGQSDVVYHGTKIEEFGAGQFVGTIDLHAESLGEFEVLTQTATRVMCWPRGKLLPFLAKRVDVALALERSVGLQVGKLLDAALIKLGTLDEGKR
jgi:hypothetical protein